MAINNVKVAIVSWNNQLHRNSWSDSCGQNRSLDSSLYTHKHLSSLVFLKDNMILYRKIPFKKNKICSTSVNQCTEEIKGKTFRNIKSADSIMPPQEIGKLDPLTF